MPPHLNDLNILYVTDRTPIADAQTNALSYGSERSRIMSFGSVDIRTNRIRTESIGRDEAGESSRNRPISEVPYPAEVSPAGYRRPPDVVAEAVASLQSEIRLRLAKTERKRISKSEGSRAEVP